MLCYCCSGWLTACRLLLKKKAKVTTGKRNAYDVAVFIMASHIHLDIEQIPDFLLRPPSWFYNKFSYKGRYHSWKEVFWQSFSNSDIELVFRMVQFRWGGCWQGQGEGALTSLYLTLLCVCLCVSLCGPQARRAGARAGGR